MMKRFLHIVPLFILLIILAKTSCAQDPQFSQFYASPLYLSPAFAGSTAGSRLVMNYRDQWPQIPGKFITYDFSFDHYFAGITSGIGLLLLRDQAGTGRLSRNHIGLQYAYAIPINPKWQIRPGVHFSRVYQSFDFNRLTFGDQLSLSGNSSSSVEIEPMQKVGYFDAAASVMGYSEKKWVGVTVDHLMRPNQSFEIGEESIVPVKLTVFGGLKVKLDKTKKRILNEENVTVSALYESQGKYDQLDLGFHYVKSPLLIGFWYRGIPLFKAYKRGYSNNDALILLAGLKIKNFTIGYSFDATISRLKASTGGAHEISISLKINQSPRKKKPTDVPCPEF
jgi:type IX secretion system PorP/SprF family membrane protein